MSKIIKYVSLSKAPHILPVPKSVSEEEALPDSPEESVVTPETEAVGQESLEEEAHQIIDEMIRLAHSEAENIRVQARIEAQALLDETALQAAEIKEKAKSEGYAAGYQQGEQEAKVAVQEQMAEEFARSVENAEQIIATAKAEGQEMLFAAERQMIELVISIAGKVLAREFDENPFAVLPIVKAALAKVKDQDEFTIRVHPEDFEVLLEAKQELQLMVGREQGVNISVDRTLQKGGCVVDTPYGSVDARLDTQMENVKKALQGAMP